MSLSNLRPENSFFSIPVAKIEMKGLQYAFSHISQTIYLSLHRQCSRPGCFERELKTPSQSNAVGVSGPGSKPSLSEETLGIELWDTLEPDADWNEMQGGG